MAEKYKVERAPNGEIGINWTDPTKTDFYVRVVKRATNVKELKAKDKRVPQTSSFGEPRTIGEISCDVKKSDMEAIKSKKCLGIMPYDGSKTIEFNIPVTIT